MSSSDMLGTRAAGSSSEVASSGRRPRRRVTRPSPAGDYDRTADRPEFQSAFRDDGERVVELDTELGTELGTEPGVEPGSATDTAGEAHGKSREFYEEQRPPHYGG